MTLSVLMPLFNEGPSIAAVGERVQAVPLDKEIILVNDVSTGGTSDLINGYYHLIVYFPPGLPTDTAGRFSPRWLTE
jgi:glycosyltransferase involved in cell wall biosynthesis